MITTLEKSPNYSGGDFLPPSAGVHDLGSTSLEWDNAYFGDDGGIYLGLDQDGGLYHKAASIAADEEITGVIEGTSDVLATAANSIYLFNITNDGDIHIVVSKGGNSHTAFLADGSTGDTILNAASGQSVDIYIAGTKEFDFTATSVDLTGAHLDNAGYLIMNAVTLPAGSEVYAGHDNTGDLTLNALSTKVINFAIAGTDEASLSATDLDLKSNTLSNVGASGNDWAANALTMSNGSSTSNMVLTVENTTNSGASNAVVDIKVGGTTSTGDPQLLWTIPSGTSWYAAADNNNGDVWVLGTGTTIGSNRYIQLSPDTTTANGLALRFLSNLPTITMTSTSTNVWTDADFAAHTINYTGNTRVTSLSRMVIFNPPTFEADGVGGDLTIDKATTIQVASPIEGSADVILSHSSAIRILNQGTGSAVIQSGLYIEDLTSGGSDYGIYLEGADTAAIWVNSADPIHVGLAGTATGKMEWDGATSGTVTVTVASAAGTWTLTLPPDNGDSGEQLQTNGSGVTTWESAASLVMYKDVHEVLNPQDALDKILGTETYKFNYARPVENGPRLMNTGDFDTEYAGVMGDDFPEIMHHGGKIFSPVSAFGYTRAAFQAMDDRIKELEDKIATLGG